MAQNSHPKHIAFIMDGNGRWATARGLERLEGHKKGAEILETIVEVAPDLGIETLTFYAFSTENWKRGEVEVSGLFKLMKHFFTKRLETLKEKGVRVRILGDKGYGSKLGDDIQEIIRTVEQETESNTKLNVNICINYGGRDELVRAAQTFAEDVEKGVRFAADLDEELFTSYLDTKGQLDPEIVIRTGGDSRVSNFLLWQLAYSELVIVNESWPDFTPQKLAGIIESYTGVERRFGALPQVKQKASSSLNDDVDVF